MALPLIFTAILALLLLAIASIDYKTMRIPDALNASLFLCAVFYWLIADRGNLLQQVVLGLIAGGALWFVRFAHMRMTGRVGLGLGDVKMVAASAAWLTPLLIPTFIFVASFTGLLFALAQSFVTGKSTVRGRIPFAPFLSIGLMSCWLMEIYL